MSTGRACCKYSRSSLCFTCERRLSSQGVGQSTLPTAQAPLQECASKRCSRPRHELRTWQHTQRVGGRWGLKCWRQGAWTSISRVHLRLRALFQAVAALLQPPAALLLPSLYLPGIDSPPHARTNASLMAQPSMGGMAVSMGDMAVLDGVLLPMLCFSQGLCE